MTIDFFILGSKGGLYSVLSLLLRKSLLISGGIRFIESHVLQYKCVLLNPITDIGIRNNSFNFAKYLPRGIRMGINSPRVFLLGDVLSFKEDYRRIT